jgi:hypothetical protein
MIKYTAKEYVKNTAKKIWQKFMAKIYGMKKTSFQKVFYKLSILKFLILKNIIKYENNIFFYSINFCTKL